MNRKLLSILLCLTLLLTVVPMGAAAAEGEKYLALGDSITTGYGLPAAETECFTYHIGQAMSYEVSNAAVDGITSGSLLTLLDSGALDQAIADARVITITCGGNDMMHTLYDEVVTQFEATYGYTITRQDVIEAFAGTSTILTKETLLPIAMVILMTFVESENFQNALLTYETNMAAIMDHILALNPNAAVILTTQYNPYKTFLPMIAQGIEDGAAALNAVITENAEENGYLVADVHGAFAASEEQLVNAYMESITDLDNMNLDFHPNAAGHRVIADTILAVIETLPPLPSTYTVTVTAGEGGTASASVESAAAGDVVELTAAAEDCWALVGWEVISGDVTIADPTAATTTFVMPAGAVEIQAVFTYTCVQAPDYGDVNCDGNVNSKDAALILQNSVGIEITVTFNETNADVNGDGVLNSKDAVLILQYAAGIITQFPAAQ